ncbi:DUF4270 family protein [Pontibacter russatus]|uniref:DUF4270 family protein n=1 Tax=Pontibacter russatus TaxID=2694929 RepID=UPI00137B3AE7|nr:DUF4270 family protein [Pontibacter russatus]
MQFSRIKTLLHHKVTLFLCCCVALVSCEDPNELGLGLVDDNIAGKYTDTLTVNVSTVYLDSLATSATGNMLAGQYTDPHSGTVLASTFFQVGLGSGTWTVAADATFDSLTLLLPYSGYSYGDTTQAVTYNIHQLAETITPRKLSPYFFNEEPYSVLYADNALYNTSATDTVPEALSSFTIVPRPATKDTLEIALSDELGQEWLSLKKAGDTNLTDATNFLSYFPGLKIKGTGGNAVLGFPVGATKVRLYYTETVNGTATAQTRDFAIVNPNLQYNQFLTNLEDSELAALVQGGEPQPASQTGGVSVSQSGSGLMVRIEVPHLASLKGQVPPDLINRAVLVVEPLSNTAQYPYPAPLEMGLYSTNSSNVPLAPLMAGTEVLKAKYEAPDQQNPSGRYDFNLTPYLVELLKQEDVPALTLLLAPPVSPYRQGVNRLVVDGQQSIKLKIYYTTIK